MPNDDPDDTANCLYWALRLERLCCAPGRAGWHNSCSSSSVCARSFGDFS